MKIKKRIFAIFTCIVMLLVFSLGTHATIFSGKALQLTEQPIQDYSKYIPSELSDKTIENICNFVNGDKYENDVWIDEIRHCGTIAMLHINYHYNKTKNTRTEIPDYLSNAYNKINNSSSRTLSIASGNYITSDSERFDIYYDSAISTNREELAYLLSVIFDSVDIYLCDIYGFSRPTTTGTKYIIKLMADNEMSYGANGEMKTYNNNVSTTYIEIRESLVADFNQNADNSYVLGVAIHEYWHAILYEYGLTSESASDIKWFHESMGRAVGIEYEFAYANSETICSSIQNFLGTNNFSLTSNNSIITYQHYGAALFELALFEDYDEWHTLANMLNNFNSTKSIMENIDITLQRYYDSNLYDMYTTFRVYNVSPDTMYLSSPYNRTDDDEHNSWGSASPQNTHNISSTNTSFSGTGAIDYLSVKYIKLTSSNLAPKTVNITVTTGISSGTPVPRIAYAIHQTNPDYYILVEPTMLGGTQSVYTLDMSTTSADEIYIVICNAGTSGTMTYSYNIVIGD